MKTIFISHPAYRLHEMGPGHPESPNRLDAIDKHLQASGLIQNLRTVVPVKADEVDLLRVHTATHWQNLLRLAPTKGYVSIDPDTILNEHTINAVLYAAGAGITAVDQVMQCFALRAFCAVRPPGHHASAEQAMGFCFINNIAVAAAYAIERYALSRIAIIDFDVHHGNGTENIFAGQESVLMCGFYQHPFFPGGRHEPPAKNMVNIPVAAYSTGNVVRDLVSTHWLVPLRKFRPQLVLISAGFDAHQDDDMSQVALAEDDYAWITEQIIQATQDASGGRIVSMLEGGYDGPSLGRSVVAHVRALIGQPAQP